jgi:pseudouridine synthase
MIIRLNKYLASAGVAARRKCDDLILSKRIKVNDKVITTLGLKIDTGVDKVKFDGKPVQIEKKFIYIILNKPKGVVTTVRDEFKRITVLDLLPVKERIWPVGRLDYNSTGLLLLTNDGELSNFLIHPRHKVLKTYHVLLNKQIKTKDLYHFEHGIILDEKKTLPCKVSEIRIINNCSYLEINISEGRNRQIRRMFEILGYRVEELERISFGPLTLAELQPGEWRYLHKKEVDILQNLMKNISD